MKGMISGIKRMEIHDGDGLRTTVFLKGCPLRCLWCHNPESLSFEKQTAFFQEKCIHCGTCKNERSEATAQRCPVNALLAYGKEYEVAELADLVCSDKPFFQNGGGVTLSGGECLGQPDFVVALAKTFHSRGVGVYVDTCGYGKRETLAQLIPYTQKFLYDIKAMDPQVHRHCTGRDNRIILDNLRYLCHQGSQVEIRYPLVMGYNDGECTAIGEFLHGLPGITKIKVLQYHKFAKSRYEALGMECFLPDTETTIADVENAVRIFKNLGLPAINGALSD